MVLPLRWNLRFHVLESSFLVSTNNSLLNDKKSHGGSFDYKYHSYEYLVYDIHSVWLYGEGKDTVSMISKDPIINNNRVCNIKRSV